MDFASSFIERSLFGLNVFGDVSASHERSSAQTGFTSAGGVGAAGAGSLHSQEPHLPLDEHVFSPLMLPSHLQTLVSSCSQAATTSSSLVAASGAAEHAMTRSGRAAMAA